MFRVEFYRTVRGESEIEDFLDELAAKALNSKNDRIQFKQVTQYIQLLSEHGTKLGENIAKHLGDGIWELRPGNNRVFFFYFEKDTYVLLHHFRKKTQKTPRKEIEKAIIERDDWIRRKR